MRLYTEHTFDVKPRSGLSTGEEVEQDQVLEMPPGRVVLSAEVQGQTDVPDVQLGAADQPPSGDRGGVGPSRANVRSLEPVRGLDLAPGAAVPCPRPGGSTRRVDFAYFRG